MLVDEIRFETRPLISNLKLPRSRSNTGCIWAKVFLPF
jgi:hypothetical protein